MADVVAQWGLWPHARWRWWRPGFSLPPSATWVEHCPHRRHNNEAPPPAPPCLSTTTEGEVVSAGCTWLPSPQALRLCSCHSSFLTPVDRGRVCPSSIVSSMLNFIILKLVHAILTLICLTYNLVNIKYLKMGNISHFKISSFSFISTPQWWVVWVIFSWQIWKIEITHTLGELKTVHQEVSGPCSFVCQNLTICEWLFCKLYY